MSRVQGETVLLQEANKAQTESPAFKKFFGKSKVVDEQGNPQVVFHGTEKRDQINKSGFKSKENEFFFSNKSDSAKEFGSQLVPVFLSLKNPLVVDIKGRPDKETFAIIDEAKAKGPLMVQ